LARNFYHSPLNPAAIDDPYDYNRDGLVNGTDQIIARNSQTNPLTMLRLIAAPAAEAGVKEASAEEPDLLDLSTAELNWLYELQQMNHRDAKRTSPAEAVVDELLATYW
jgi:hypothetical protein